MTIKATYDPAYVMLCLGLAFGACYCVTCLCEQLRLAFLKSTEEKPNHEKKLILQILTAVCLGGIGKWSMHVIGMSSLVLHDDHGRHITVNYNVGVSVMSLIVVLVTSTISIIIATKDPMFAKSKKEIIDMFLEHAAGLSMNDAMKISAFDIIRIISTKSLNHLLLGGMVAGSGVAVMHYIGVAAMDFEGQIDWLPGVVAASVLIACVACMAAFWILFRLLSIFPSYESLRLASAFIMSIAVCGVHYIGMMASVFVTSSGARGARMGTATMTPNQSLIGPLVAAVAVLWMINLYVLIDLRAFAYEGNGGHVSASPRGSRASKVVESPRFVKASQVRPEETASQDICSPV
eukprot:gene6248-6889_t